MRFILAVFTAVSVSFAGGPFYPDSMNTISKAKSMNSFIFSSSVKPFGWCDTVNVASANWTCPDSIWVKGVYVTTFCTVSIQSRGSGKAVPVVIDSLCGLPIDVKIIYSAGTTEAARSGGKILLVGDRAW